jgi:DivIVA domain-containing protein
VNTFGAMSPRSTESLAVYVRQRAFKKVMRGYDPDEVDEHLERVAQMISTGAVADLAREQEERLQERELAVAAQEVHANHLVEQAERELNAARIEADATIQGATAKAKAIEQEAQQVLDQARLEAEASETISQAREEAAATVAQAREEADTLIATAKADGLKAVEQEIAEYVARRRREADRIVEQARRGETP